MATHLRECARLDREIRAESQQRTIFDPQLRGLRSVLRSQCEAALLADFRLAQKHDVEQLLWKAVFYRPIEEFRRRVKQAEGELRDKTKLAFHAFLEDAKGFYLQLTMKLQQRLGDAGFPTALAAQHLQQMGLAPPVPVQPASRGQDCRPAVHRCLVCLGDMCRYQVNVQPAASRDWAPCRHFYLLAARLLPGSGNSYNQLAVLSTYEGDDLGAAFFYCRALAAATSFVVARENLISHFEQNKAACARLAAAGTGGSRGTRPASQALRELRVRFTRVLGMLFTRDSLDAFPAQLAAAMADLDDHLLRLRQQSRKVSLAAAAEREPPVLVQLAAAAVYAVHAAGASRQQGQGQQQPGQTPQVQQGQEQQGQGQTPQQAALSFAGVAAQQVVRGLALQLLFCLTARLAEAAAAAAGGKQGLLGSSAGVLLLPPLRLLLQWLAAAGAPAVVPHAGDSADLLAARQQLWQAAAQLVTALQEAERGALAEARQAGTAGIAGTAAGTAGTAGAAGTAGTAGTARAELAVVVLPEDGQLAGFQPLSRGGSWAGTANWQAGSGGSESAGYGDAAAAAARVQRMLGDAASIARLLASDGSSGSSGAARGQAALRQAQAAFVQAAEPLQGRHAEQQQQQQQQGLAAHTPAAGVAWGGPAPGAPATAGSAQPAPAARHPAARIAAAAAPLPPPLPVAAAPQAEQAGAEAMEEDHVEEEEEEEEEVILYAPQARHTPSPTPAPAPGAAAGAAQAGPPATAAGAAGAVAKQAQQQQQQQQQEEQQQQQQQQQTSVPVAAPPVPAAAAGAALGAEAAGAVGGDVLMGYAEMEQTAQAVAGSVLPFDDQQAGLPPHYGDPAVGAQAHGQQPGQQAQQAQQAQQSAMQMPAAFFTLFGGPPQQQAQQAQQQAQQAQQAQQQQLPGMAPAAVSHPAAAAVPAGLPFQQQAQQAQQQAAGLRSLLFGGGASVGACGSAGVGSSGGGWSSALAGPAGHHHHHQQQQGQQQGQGQASLFPQQHLSSPPGVAGPSAPANSAGLGVLLAPGTAADRWAWMGAFGGPPPAGAGAAAAGAAVAAAPMHAQLSVPGAQPLPRGPVLRTDNPFVP